MTQEYKLALTRESERRTADETLREQLDFIARRGLAGSRGKGWGFEVGSINATQYARVWTFRASIRFYRKSGIDAALYTAKLAEILEWSGAAGHNSKFGRCPWVAKPENQEAAPSEEMPEEEDFSSDIFSYTPLAGIEEIKRGNLFEHLYGLDSQIEILLSALQAAADSEMANRFHSLLYGAPGCGKTEILLSFARLLRKLGVNCLLLDATSTTEAGIRKTLLDEDSTPPDVIIVEEIEKVPDTALRPLLGIMDSRATVSQTNARRTASRKVPAIILATANDMDQLKRMMYGALHSRFQHKVHCPRPGREVLAKILEREVRRVSGLLEWIEPTLQFCYDEHGATDPRELIPVCLCGKDKLLSGVYQKHLLATMEPKPVPF